MLDVLWDYFGPFGTNLGPKAQDIYLTGNPQITFFKVVYRRHTSFSVEAIEQTLV